MRRLGSLFVVVLLVSACVQVAGGEPTSQIGSPGPDGTGSPGVVAPSPTNPTAVASSSSSGAEKPTAQASTHATETAEASLPPEEPTVEPIGLSATSCDPDQAWVGLFGDGVICLDDAGWKAFDDTNSAIVTGQTHDVAACEDGTTWIADSGQLVSTDGTAWMGHGPTLTATGITPIIEFVECDPAGGVWLGGYDTLIHYDGVNATVYPTSNLGTGEYVAQVKGLAIAPDGNLWVSTSNSVATFDGQAWTYWEKGRGFDKDIYFERLIVDPKGTVWAAASGGMQRFDGTKWSDYTSDFLSQPKPLALDKAGNLWVGTYADGLAMFNGKGWVRYTRANSKLPSDKIESLAIDDAGRVWVGTEWGLAILDGKEWQVYHMSDSALLDNEIFALGVTGSGPDLPDPQQKAPGTLTGRIIVGGQPLTDASVEACVEFIGMMFSGDTPCADQAFHKLTTTDADGRFTFPDLPVGKYALAFRNAAGDWLRLTDGFKVGDKETTVPEGGTADIGDIDVAQD